MIDQHDEDVAIFQRSIEVDQRRAGAFEFARQFGGIGFDHLDAGTEAARQRGGD